MYDGQIYDMVATGKKIPIVILSWGDVSTDQKALKSISVKPRVLCCTKNKMLQEKIRLPILVADQMCTALFPIEYEKMLFPGVAYAVSKFIISDMIMITDDYYLTHKGQRADTIRDHKYAHQGNVINIPSNTALAELGLLESSYLRRMYGLLFDEGDLGFKFYENWRRLSRDTTSEDPFVNTKGTFVATAVLTVPDSSKEITSVTGERDGGMRTETEHKVVTYVSNVYVNETINWEPLKCEIQEDQRLLFQIFDRIDNHVDDYQSLLPVYSHSSVFTRKYHVYSAGLVILIKPNRTRNNLNMCEINSKADLFLVKSKIFNLDPDTVQFGCGSKSEFDKIWNSVTKEAQNTRHWNKNHIEAKIKERPNIVKRSTRGRGNRGARNARSLGRTYNYRNRASRSAPRYRSYSRPRRQQSTGRRGRGGRGRGNQRGRGGRGRGGGGRRDYSSNYSRDRYRRNRYY